MFLVRDWANYRETPYGIHEESKKYLETALSSASTGGDSPKGSLNACFSNVECCLLPHPGQIVPGATGIAEIQGKISDEFTEQTADFVARILHPENIVTKKIGGKVVKSSFFAQYITSCFKHLPEKKLLDESQTMLEAVVAAKNFQVQKLCYDMYCENMTKFVVQLQNAAESFTTDAILHEFHKETLTISMEIFDKKSKLGGENMRKAYRNDLNSAIEREFRVFSTDNRNRRFEAEKVAMASLQNSMQEYKEKMEKATAGKKSLKKDDLQKLHNTHHDVVVSKFSNSGVHDMFKAEYSEQLTCAIKRFYENIKHENEEKIRVEEAKEMQERKMLDYLMTLKKQYREELQKVTVKYVSENVLIAEDDDQKNSLKQRLDKKVQEVSILPSALIQYQKSLATMLNTELEQFKKINEENKKRLMRKLEFESTKAYVEYDQRIRMKLKEGYLKRDELRKAHNKLKNHLMEGLKKSIGYDKNLPQFVEEHFTKTNINLEKRFEDTEKWNEANKTCKIL